MLNVLTNICAWLLLIAEFVILFLMISFLLFGGKFTISVQLKGPLRFMSTRHEDSSTYAQVAICHIVTGMTM